MHRNAAFHYHWHSGGEPAKAVAFDRDILTEVDNGWLVPVKQAFVRVNTRDLPPH